MSSQRSDGSAVSSHREGGSGSGGGGRVTPSVSRESIVAERSRKRRLSSISALADKARALANSMEATDDPDYARSMAQLRHLKRLILAVADHINRWRASLKGFMDASAVMFQQWEVFYTINPRTNDYHPRQPVAKALDAAHHGVLGKDLLVLDEQLRRGPLLKLSSIVDEIRRLEEISAARDSTCRVMDHYRHKVHKLQDKHDRKPEKQTAKDEERLVRNREKLASATTEYHVRNELLVNDIRRLYDRRYLDLDSVFTDTVRFYRVITRQMAQLLQDVVPDELSEAEKRHVPEQAAYVADTLATDTAAGAPGGPSLDGGEEKEGDGGDPFSDPRAFAIEASRADNPHGWLFSAGLEAGRHVIASCRRGPGDERGTLELDGRVVNGVELFGLNHSLVRGLSQEQVGAILREGDEVVFHFLAADEAGARRPAAAAAAAATAAATAPAAAEVAAAAASPEPLEDHEPLPREFTLTVDKREHPGGLGFNTVQDQQGRHCVFRFRRNSSSEMGPLEAGGVQLNSFIVAVNGKRVVNRSLDRVKEAIGETDVVVFHLVPPDDMEEEEDEEEEDGVAAGAAAATTGAAGSDDSDDEGDVQVAGEGQQESDAPPTYGAATAGDEDAKQQDEGGEAAEQKEAKKKEEPAEAEAEAAAAAVAAAAAAREPKQDEAAGAGKGGDEAVAGACANGCGRVETNEELFFVCSRCESTRYCGEKCQRAHWKKHKKVCGKGNA